MANAHTTTHYTTSSHLPMMVAVFGHTP